MNSMKLRNIQRDKLPTELVPLESQFVRYKILFYFCNDV